MSSICVDDWDPVFFYDVENPKIAKYLSFITHSSKDNNVVVKAKHNMPKPRCRRIPFLRRMIMPSLIILLILKNIIQINRLIPNCPSPSKHIQPLIPILARPMILPRQERITVSNIRTQHFELISFLNPRNQFGHVTSTSRFHIDPQRGIC